MTFNSTIKIKYGLCQGLQCRYKADKQPLAHNKLRLCKYCNDVRKAILSDSKDSKPKKRVSIPKVSDKMLEKLKEYRIKRDIYLMVNTICEVKGCGKPSNNIHHKRGRVGDLLSDQRYFMACCGICHPNKIHNNVAWAKEMGYILPKQ